MSADGAKGNVLWFDLPVGDGSRQQVGMPSHKLNQLLLMARNERSEFADCYQNAARKLLDWNESLPSRVFVTSPRSGDGKTCTAFNLAWTAAQSGRKVLLAELNFSKPQFRDMLGNLKLRYGLENALRGSVHPEDVVFAAGAAGLHIAAVRNATPADKVQAIVQRFEAFLDWGSESYEMIVIDCPPVISREWGVWFSALAGPALLVVREDQTPLVEVRRAAQRLGSRLKGVLLNRLQTGGLIHSRGTEEPFGHKQQTDFATQASR